MTGLETIMAGTAIADITPPLAAGLLTSSVKGTYAPFNSVRLPLKARVLALGNGNNAIALVALDLLALNDTATGGWQRFKEGLAGPLAPERVILTCTHTHSAPESVALSDLYLTPAYREWLQRVQHSVRAAIGEALAGAKPCTPSIGTAVLENYSLQRRIPTPAGITMSDALQPVAPGLMKREPVDRRVHALRLHDAAGNVVATLVHAVCHPVHEMCLPHVSPDFPGELCLALEASPGNGMPLFINGAAGDINPPTVSCGPDAARRHGQAMAAVVQEKCAPAPLKAAPFMALYREMQLGVRAEAGVNNAADALARLHVLRIGPLAIVFLPGEPFTEIALEIAQYSPFPYTLVAAYAENTVGYIPPPAALREGGYEAGPGKWSFLEEGAAARLTAATLELLSALKQPSI